MPGGVQELDLHLAHRQPIPVVHRFDLIAELGASAREQLDVPAQGQLADTGHVVVVLVGVGGVANAHALGAGLLEVGLDIAAHVEHQCFAGLLRADEV
jgi:hypothetical protein